MASSVLQLCSQCEGTISAAEMFSHLEEHVGPRVFEAVSLKCRDCPFSVLLSEQNLFSLMKHCAMTGHKGRKAEADWEGFVKNETRRIRQMISLGAKNFNRNDPSKNPPPSPSLVGAETEAGPTPPDQVQVKSRSIPKSKSEEPKKRRGRPPSGNKKPRKRKADSAPKNTDNQLYLPPHIDDGSISAKLASIPTVENEDRVISSGKIDLASLTKSNGLNDSDGFDFPGYELPNEDELICGETTEENTKRRSSERSEMETSLARIECKEEPMDEADLPLLNFGPISEDSVMEFPNQADDADSLNSTPSLKVKARPKRTPRAKGSPKKPKTPRTTDYRDLSCKICQLRPEIGWTGKWNILYHLFSHDNSVIPFQCGQCPYVTATKTTMVYHSKRKSAAMKGCDGSYNNIQTEEMIAKTRQLLEKGFPEINWTEKFPPGQIQNGVKF